MHAPDQQSDPGWETASGNTGTAVPATDVSATCTHASTAPPTDRLRAVLWLHASLSLVGCIVITLTMFADTAILRAYRNLDLPTWLWHLEDAMSRHAHKFMLVLAAVLLIVFPPRATVECVRTLPLLRWRTTGIAGRGPLIAHAVWTAGLAALFTHTLKPSIGRVRPCDSGDALLLMPFHGWHVSYPSGHATTMFATAFVLTRWRPQLGPLWFGLCLPLAWARVHTDAHFVSDVFAAFFVCLAADRLAFALANPPSLRALDSLRRWPVAALLAILWLAAVVLPPVLTIPLHAEVRSLPTIAAQLPPQRTPGVPSVISEPEAIVDDDQPDDTAKAASQRIVEAIYARILQREADESGLANWTEHLLQKGVPLEVVKSMATSSEFRHNLNVQFSGDRASLVGEVYRRLLGRPPDEHEVTEALAVVKDDELGFDFQRGLDNLVLRLTISREYLEKFGSFQVPHDDRE